MTEESKIEEEVAVDSLERPEDDNVCCVGPCDVWPPKLGNCGSGKVWVFIAGRWICRPA